MYTQHTISYDTFPNVQKHCYSILLTTDFMIYFAWSPFTGLVNQSLEMLI